MMKKDVLVIGELNVDILLNGIQGFPAVGQEILADEMALVLGSSSAIFAANLGSLGISTAFCGMVGKDLFGTFILDALCSKRIDTSLVIESEVHRTGLTMVMNYAQDRANVTHCGAMEHLSIQHIPVARFSEFRHLHLSSYFLQKGLQQHIVALFRTAHEQGLSTSMDIQWDPSGQWNFPYAECLPYVDFFLPNEAELLSLTNTHKLPDALEQVHGFANTVIVKRGTSGAVAYKKGLYLQAPPYLHGQFVDAIGAGDSFNAGFISSYLQGKSLEESLSFGNLAGAINTTATGGTGAFSDLPSFIQKAKTMFNIDI